MALMGWRISSAGGKASRFDGMGAKLPEARNSTQGQEQNHGRNTRFMSGFDGSPASDIPFNRGAVHIVACQGQSPSKKSAEPLFCNFPLRDVLLKHVRRRSCLAVPSSPEGVVSAHGGEAGGAAGRIF